MDSCCETTARHFDETNAQEDLHRYREKGPDQTTNMLLEMLSTIDNWGSSLLDVGGGIGVIPFELSADGAEEITFIEISPSSIQTAETEAGRLGIRDRIQFINGDFVDQAENLPEADLVTLDRVVCCYPNFKQLVALSAAKARKWYALSFPRDRWYTKLSIAFNNWIRHHWGDSFRSYVHPEDQIHEILQAAGLERHTHRRTFFWQIDIYRRVV
jgi:magnesium-protoporphyrin O-methyltransferase